MYFTSDRPGGLGGSDIYYVVKRKGVWGKPIGLGSIINSKYEEKFPFIAPDGTLYFSSNALDGLGGLDIYQTRFVDGSWTKPENLGVPVNSNKDDFSYIIDDAGQLGYFSSNREGGHGDDDIYAFTKNLKREFRIKVIDADSKQSIALSTVSTNLNSEELSKLMTDENGIRKLLVDLNIQQVINISKSGYKSSVATIQPNDKSGELVIELKKLPLQLMVIVKDKETLEPIANVVVNIRGKLSGDLSFKTGEAGSFESMLNQGDYLVSSPDYNTISDIFSNLDADPQTGILKKEYFVTRVKFTVGQKWVFKNLYYDLDKSFIRPDAALELDNVVKIMTENPRLEIELSSHTDCRNSKAYNQALSERRAKAAVEYIVNKGISASRIKAVGYGETQLTNACACEGAVQSTCTEEEHQANRRTEVKVLKY